MVLFPRMIRIIVEGLMPLSEAAKGFFAKHFSGREVVHWLGFRRQTLGHPTTAIIGTFIILLHWSLQTIIRQ